MDGILFPLILTIHILVGAAVIGLVLLQHGKGADMGAAFGSGASGSLFGASGSANFLSRTTAILATVFFLTSLGLSYLATNRPQAPSSVMEQVKTPPVAPLEQVPAQPAAGADSKAKEIPK
jgi:preprotein translocase subunit SecG